LILTAALSVAKVTPFGAETEAITLIPFTQDAAETNAGFVHAGFMEPAVGIGFMQPVVGIVSGPISAPGWSVPLDSVD
jgi:hypothetical protein